MTLLSISAATLIAIAPVVFKLCYNSNYKANHILPAIAFIELHDNAYKTLRREIGKHFNNPLTQEHKASASVGAYVVIQSCMKKFADEFLYHPEPLMEVVYKRYVAVHSAALYQGKHDDLRRVPPYAGVALGHVWQITQLLSKFDDCIANRPDILDSKTYAASAVCEGLEPFADNISDKAAFRDHITKVISKLIDDVMVKIDGKANVVSG